MTVKNAQLVGGSKLKVDQGDGDDTTVIDGCDVGNLNINGRTSETKSPSRTATSTSASRSTAITRQ